MDIISFPVCSHFLSQSIFEHGCHKPSLKCTQKSPKTSPSHVVTVLKKQHMWY